MKRVFEKVKADKRIVIGYSASLLLLLITYVVTVVANEKLQEKSNLIEHTNKVIFDLELLLSTIKDAETGARGYALTMDTDFLEPYNHSKKTTDSLQLELHQNTPTNSLQRQRLADLKVDIEKRFDILVRTIEYFKNGRVDSIFKVRATQLESKRVMDKIRMTVAFAQKEEKKNLLARDSELKNTFTSIRTITISSLLLTLLLVIIGFVSYANENKARKIALRNLKDYQDQLSKRIEQLNSANAQLLQMRSMEKFTATGRIARTIAHEVRNPLTNINLATSQLKTDIPEIDDNLLYLFGIIDRNSQRINKLISELLNTTKFSELNFTMVYVSNLLEEALTLAKDRILLNNITIEKDYLAHCHINVDAEKIKIAFLNIIINAIEATISENRIIKIKTYTESGNCFIEISDNGVGMDETALSKLFEPYFTSKVNGNGLGLANTQNIIFNHKGVINVTSEKGKGSTFTIILAAA